LGADLGGRVVKEVVLEVTETLHYVQRFLVGDDFDADDPDQVTDLWCEQGNFNAPSEVSSRWINAFEDEPIGEVAV
jgi:hypothetical protein